MGQLEKARGGRLNIDFLYTHPTSDNRVKVRRELIRLSFFDERHPFCSQMLQGLLSEAHTIQANSSMCVEMQEQLESFRDAVGFGASKTFQGSQNRYVASTT
jgi:hypothetical protein